MAAVESEEEIYLEPSVSLPNTPVAAAGGRGKRPMPPVTGRQQSQAVTPTAAATAAAARPNTAKKTAGICF